MKLIILTVDLRIYCSVTRLGLGLGSFKRKPDNNNNKDQKTDKNSKKTYNKNSI